MGIWSEAYARPRLPITRRILDACTAYPWPGNVRELENFVKRYLVHGSENEAVTQLGFETRSPRVNSGVSMNGSTDCGDLKSLVRDRKEETERAAIMQTLARAGGNRQLAAKLLRISLRALQYKIQRYGVGVEAGRAPNDVDAAEITPAESTSVEPRLQNPVDARNAAERFDA
jgi:two-component system response regulator AtoC